MQSISVIYRYSSSSETIMQGRVGAFMSHAAESSSARKRSSSRISKLTPIQVVLGVIML